MQGFRSSINLQLDILNQELLYQYVLTPSHSEVLRGILEGVTQDAAHAHLLIGAYGTGKSLLATIVCQFLSRQFSSEWRARLLVQAERIDTQLAARLREAECAEMTYIPVVINGRTGSLRKIVNQAIFRSLHQAGIEIATPNEAKSILDTVDRWKQDYATTYASFQSHLIQQEWLEAEWRSSILNYNEEVTRDFIAFYPTVTSGTPWAIEHETYFVDNLEWLSTELSAQKVGLIIVYDEFGRFLQSLGGPDTVQNMQDLQDFAEFVDRSPNAHLLVVGHKHIRQYAVNERESVRGEFEKVEKRFRFYSLATDASTFLRLAQEAIAPINTQCLLDGVDLETLEKLQSYPFFSEYTSYQLEHGMIRTLYPLHPVAVLLLPQLSNIFGQNERTLYSFLADNERYSLIDHVHQRSGYYFADQLFHFFNIESAEVGDQSSLQLYHTIAPYLDSEHSMKRRIVELLTLWTVTRLTQKQPPTLSFLAFALGSTLEETKQVLDELLKAKIIRYNSIRDLWELYDGSSMDVNAVVAAKMNSVSLSVRESFALLERHLPLTYVMPYEYNDDMDMLRYADVRFTNITELKSGYDTIYTADDRIWLVLYMDADEMDDPDVFMNELKEPYCVAFPMFTAENIRPSLLHYKIIDQLLHDPAFLAEDGRVKNELIYMLQETSMRIKAFVDRYFVFEELDWRWGSERRLIRDLRGLEGLVTERLRSTYQDTPIIRNEAFNRNRISGIQRRALIDVIDRVIREPNEPTLGIEGYGPNYLIYASVLKNNGYTFDAESGVCCTGKLEVIRDELRRRLDEQPIGKLSQLVSMLGEPPYGIRAAVVPLLFVALLRDRWNQLLFYSHDMLTTHLSGVSVLELIELSESYEYRYFKWTLEEQNQLEELGHHFGLPAEACTSFVHVASALLLWLRSLPKYSQITTSISPATRQIRDHIRGAEIDPYVHMKELASYGNKLADAKKELESFIETNEVELIRHVLNLTGLESLSQLSDALVKLRDGAISKNSKLSTLPKLENEHGMMDWLAEHLVGVPRIEWSDATQDLLLGQIKYEWQLLQVKHESASTYDIVLEPIVPWSKKSQTLYINVKNMMKYAGKDISAQEIRQLLLKLLQEIE
ncbi:hypothetical protein [Paenibacillus sp. AD87]|uniref:hypothetical protein n=1 Tax=Paenibacillus sp. AD87 TaxID=1528787 RepID=UPI0007E33758|nr:hypothetical protein [Paenibacillus sp. AD87]OAX50847.1 hypothetical protein gpAD87_21820 [Paenibacillus sp. AD87]